MKIIAFTGAGISKDSGIDTFQDRPGIRDKLTRTYAMTHPAEYKKVIEEFRNNIKDKEPNDAHIALAEYKIPIITMNVDDLHEKAGTIDIIKLHGRLPNDEEMIAPHLLKETPVLYEDKAPKYQIAFDKMNELSTGDIFLVIGASDYTTIACNLKLSAIIHGAEIIEIQENAKINVRKELERLINNDKTR